MQAQKIIKIKREDAGKRLDAFIATALSAFSRHAVKRSISAGQILLNNKVAKPSVKLKAEDKIIILRLPARDGRLALIPQKEITLPIIYEDRDILVVDKPAGISAHPSLKERSGTIANALIAYLPGLGRVGEDPLRPGIVHRLDKDTSGLLVVAKNQKTFLWLKEQFAKRLVEKHYLALIEGNLKQRRGTITLPLKKVALRHVAVRTGPSAQTLPGLSPRTKPPYSQILNPSTRLRAGNLRIREAETGFRLLKRFPQATLVLVRPKTGRMHQIRSHFAAIGHPIVGDTLYGSKKRPEGLMRHFLHATRLEFSMPDGKRLNFESELPEGLKEYLGKIADEAGGVDAEPEVRYE